MPRKPLYHGCKFDGCDKKHYCKGWCKTHYGALHKGYMNEDGTYKEGHKFAPKGRVCRYPDCDVVGTKKTNLRSGLCNRHRKWAEKGIIDKETCEILDVSRIPKERQHLRCKMSGCVGKHKARGFCSNHYRSLLNGIIDEDGRRNLEKRRVYTQHDRCKVRTCFSKHRLNKGFCLKHYQQFTRGLIDEWGMELRKPKAPFGLEWDVYNKMKKDKAKRLRAKKKAKELKDEQRQNATN